MSKSAASFFSAQSSFDFASIMAESEMQVNSSNLLIELKTSHETAKANSVSFTRLLNNPKGHYKNHYLCDCASEWTVKSDEIASDICQHCFTAVEPLLSNDGSITSTQVENLLIATKLNRAFFPTEKGVSVFENLLQNIKLVNFSAEDVGEIAYA
jgi:hypothetical protein